MGMATIKGYLLMASQVNVRIENWEEFYKIAHWFLSQKEETDNWVFRGQKDATWELKTTLERQGDEATKKFVKTRSDYVNTLCNHLRISSKANEERMLSRFKDYWVQEGHKDYYGKLPMLAIMQHYGLPTRLLDFSRSLFVAVYFAFEETSFYGDRAIWAIKTNPIIKKLDRIERPVWLKNGFSSDAWLLEFADDLLSACGRKNRKGILPVRIRGNSPRMIAQKGLFLMPFSRCFRQNLDYAYSDSGIVPYKNKKGTKIGDGMPIHQFLDMLDKSDICIIKMICAGDMETDADDVFHQVNISGDAIYPDKGVTLENAIDYRFSYSLT